MEQIRSRTDHQRYLLVQPRLKRDHAEVDISLSLRRFHFPESVTSMDLDNAVREFEQLATIDYVGFWELFRVVNDDLEDENPENVKQLVLELTKRLLSRGFLA